MEMMLGFFSNFTKGLLPGLLMVQTQQRAERDAAVALLEQSRIVLAMRLADAQSSNCKDEMHKAADNGPYMTTHSPGVLLLSI